MRLLVSNFNTSKTLTKRKFILGRYFFSKDTQAIASIFGVSPQLAITKSGLALVVNLSKIIKPLSTNSLASFFVSHCLVGCLEATIALTIFWDFKHLS